MVIHPGQPGGQNPAYRPSARFDLVYERVAGLRDKAGPYPPRTKDVFLPDCEAHVTMERLCFVENLRGIDCGTDVHRTKAFMLGRTHGQKNPHEAVYNSNRGFWFLA